MSDEFTVSSHFEGRDPAVAAIYKRLITEARKFGPMTEDPKKTSIHLNHKTAFAGIRTQKKALLVNIKSAAVIKDPRISKSEKLSANRYHQEIKLTSPEEVDAQLVVWLKDAYLISG
jgi:hypothetical protein